MTLNKEGIMKKFILSLAALSFLFANSVTPAKAVATHDNSEDRYYIYAPTVNGFESYERKYTKHLHELEKLMNNRGFRKVMSNGEANLHVRWSIETSQHVETDYEQPGHIKKSYGDVEGFTSYNERISGTVTWNRGYGRFAGILGYNNPFEGQINYNRHGDGHFDIYLNDGLIVSGSVNFVTRDMIEGVEVMELVGYDQYNVRYQMRLEVPLQTVASKSKCSTFLQFDIYEGTVNHQYRVYSNAREMKGCNLDRTIPKMLKSIVNNIQL